MDAAIGEIRKAGTKEQKLAAFTTIAQLYTQDVPVLSFGAVPQFVSWNAKVNGIVPTSSAVVYFDKAWIAP